MTGVCEGLERCRLYIDGICTLSNSGAEHVENIARFFELLTKNQLEIGT